MVRLSVFVSALTMLGATTDLVQLFQLESIRSQLGALQPKEFEEAVQLHLERARFAALGELRSLRIGIALLLSMACGLAFAASLRLLYPVGLSREGMRRLLVKALLWTAGLRTVAGAADAGVARYLGDSLGASYDELPGYQGWLQALPSADPALRDSMLPGVMSSMATLFVTTSVIYTLLVAGVFVLLWRYFGREDVVRTIALGDERRSA